MLGAHKSHASLYHPVGNGIAECFNRTPGDMLGVLPLTAKARWWQMRKTLTFCYNCTVHKTTNFASVSLGQVLRVLIDIMFLPVHEDEKVVGHNEFVSRLRLDNYLKT